MKYKVLINLKQILSFFVLVLVVLTLGIKTGFCLDTLELAFFADESNLKVESRRKIVKFLKSHKDDDIYEFEIHSLSDPLDMGVDIERLTEVQGVFREYGVQVDKLVDAKVRFISGVNQKLIIIRKKRD